MRRVRCIDAKRPSMHAVCQKERKRASAGQNKAHLRPEIVQPSPRSARGLGAAKNSQRGLDLHRRRRLPGWSVFLADDHLPRLGPDCARMEVFPIGTLSMRHEYPWMTRSRTFARTPNVLIPPRAQLDGQMGQNLPRPTPQAHACAVTRRDRRGRGGHAPRGRSPHPSAPRGARLALAHLARGSFEPGKADIAFFRAKISEGMPLGLFRTVRMAAEGLSVQCVVLVQRQK